MSESVRKSGRIRKPKLIDDDSTGVVDQSRPSSQKRKAPAKIASKATVAPKKSKSRGNGSKGDVDRKAPDYFSDASDGPSESSDDDLSVASSRFSSDKRCEVNMWLEEELSDSSATSDSDDDASRTTAGKSYSDDDVDDRAPAAVDDEETRDSIVRGEGGDKPSSSDRHLRYAAPFAEIDADKLPSLELPTGSSDLILNDTEMLMDALEIYELLRRYHGTIRLSPFIFENFLSALVSNEQSCLLAEVHISLMRLCLRDDEAEHIQYLPLEQKEQFNLFLHLLSPMTYSEVIRQYAVSLGADTPPAVLAALSKGDYPLVACKQRVTVLQWLTRRLLQMRTSFRDCMPHASRPRKIVHDDHCRDCGTASNATKGLMVNCDTCTATYHMKCIQPAVDERPPKPWFCCICQLHQVSGVYDCITKAERTNFSIRQQSLGIDRHGRRYWFLVRRLFVFDETKNTVKYYSTPCELRVLFARLDADDLERRLCAQLIELIPTLVKQMRITQQLTEQSLAEVLDAQATRRATWSFDTHSHLMKIQVTLGEKRERPEFERLLAKKKAEEDGVPMADAEDNKAEEVVVVKTFEHDHGTLCANEGTHDHGNYVEDDREDRRGPRQTRLMQRIDWYAAKTLQMIESFRSALLEREEKARAEALSNNVPRPPSKREYKLGTIATVGYRKYTNHYRVSDYAKSPHERAKDRDKMNFMARKFSIDGEGQFYWPPCTAVEFTSHPPPSLMQTAPLVQRNRPLTMPLPGTTAELTKDSVDVFSARPNVLGVVRSSVQQLLDKVPMQMMHRLWSTDGLDRVKRLMQRALTASRAELPGRPPNETPADHEAVQCYVQVIALLELCMRRSILHSSWHQNLGFTRFAHHSAEDKELRVMTSKQQKEALVELQRADPADDKSGIAWVKYTRTGPPAHQLWKLKDEQYRVNNWGAMGGWQWIRVGRRPVDRVDVDNEEVKERKKKRIDAIAGRMQDKRKKEIGDTVELRCRGVRLRCYSSDCRRDFDDESQGANCMSSLCRYETHKVQKEIYDALSSSGVHYGHASYDLRKLERKRNRSGESDNSEATGRKEPFALPTPHQYLSVHTDSKSERSVLVLPARQLQWLARVYINYTRDTLPLGFSGNSRVSSQHWPYPCVRPLVQTCWRYNLLTSRSTHAVALYMRMLCSYVKWDMLAEQLSFTIPTCIIGKVEGEEHRVILNHREFAPCGTYTHYMCQVTYVPLDIDNQMDKKRRSKAAQEDLSFRPSGVVLSRDRRSGARASQRQLESSTLDDSSAESDAKESIEDRQKVDHVWIGEHKLNVWEMRAYWERLERTTRDAVAADLRRQRLDDQHRRQQEQYEMQNASMLQQQQRRALGVMHNGQMVYGVEAKRIKLDDDSPTKPRAMAGGFPSVEDVRLRQPLGVPSTSGMMPRAPFVVQSRPLGLNPIRVQSRFGTVGGVQVVRLNLDGSAASGGPVAIIPGVRRMIRMSNGQMVSAPAPVMASQGGGPQRPHNRTLFIKEGGNMRQLTQVELSRLNLTRQMTTVVHRRVEPAPELGVSPQMGFPSRVPIHLPAAQSSSSAQFGGVVDETGTPIHGVPIRQASSFLASGISSVRAPTPLYTQQMRRQQFLNQAQSRQMRDKMILAEHEDRQRKREEAQTVSEVRQTLTNIVSRVCFDEQKRKRDEMAAEQKREKLLIRQQKHARQRALRERRQMEKRWSAIMNERQSVLRHEVNKRRMDYMTHGESLARISFAQVEALRSCNSVQDYAEVTAAQPLGQSVRHGGTAMSQDTPSLLAQLPRVEIVDTSRVAIDHSSEREDGMDRERETRGGKGKTRGRRGRARENKRTTSNNSESKWDKLTKQGSVHCICRTQYNPKKFYLNCDLCSHWYHGACVGVSEKQAKKMDEFTCADCQTMKRESESELYCVCRTSYDEGQFYVGCDGCEGWFHPQCVGITRDAAKHMKSYNCDECLGKSSGLVDHTLTRHDYKRLKAVLNELFHHKTAWPFRFPVDAKEVPSYYEVIRQPIDLSAISKKVNDHVYAHLSDFLVDITLMFSNARTFNPPDDPIYQCSVMLERHMRKELRDVKQAIMADVDKQMSAGELAQQHARGSRRLTETAT